MFGKIARFELRYQLTGPVFLSMTALFFVLAFGSIAIDQLQLSGGGQVHRNAGPAIARSYAILTLFLMFVTTAFVANQTDDCGPSTAIDRNLARGIRPRYRSRD